MLNNRLIQIIQTFSRKEMTRFYDFAQSPYFNKHTDVRQLLAYLNKCYPKFTAKNCEKERLFQQIFPEKAFHQAQLALVFTYSFRLLERFLIQEQFQQDSDLGKVFLLQQLRQRGQYSHYERVLQLMENELEKAALKDSDFYHRQFITAAESDA